MFMPMANEVESRMILRYMRVIRYEKINHLQKRNFFVLLVLLSRMSLELKVVRRPSIESA